MKKSEMIKFLSEELDAYLNLDKGYKEGESGGELLFKKLEEKGIVSKINFPIIDNCGTCYGFKTIYGWDED